MSGTISKENLLGVEEALSIHAKDLLPAFHRIIKNSPNHDPLESPSWTRGENADATFIATVSRADGEPILRALEDINRKAGQEVWTFNGLTIDWLTISWRQFVAEPPPQSP